MQAMSDIYIRQLDEFLNLYKEACNWFSQLELEWVETRYGIYEEHFAQFKRHAQSSDADSIDIDCKSAFDNAYLEANEVVRVYADLRNFEQSEYMTQLRRVMKGDEFRAQTENDQARDFIFELSTAARFLRGNFPVILSGVCDVVVQIPEGRLFIECKRIKSKKTIAKNVKIASGQLKKRMGRKTSKKVYGLVAINVTDLVEGPKIILPDSPQAIQSVHRKIANKFLSDYVDKLKPLTSSKRMLGAMVENAAMWYLSDRSQIQGVSYNRHTNFLQLQKPEILERLAPVICNQDIVS